MTRKKLVEWETNKPLCSKETWEETCKETLKETCKETRKEVKEVDSTTRTRCRQHKVEKKE